MRYITIPDSGRLPAGWSNCPSIDASGSVTGMVKHFGWMPGQSFRIGAYIYNFPKGKYYDAAVNLARGR